MSFNAETITQARQLLIAATRDKLELAAQLRDQARKIADLEREVQKQATAASQAQQAVANARIEIQALRTMIPDEPTRRAFDDLVEYLATPAQNFGEMRVAA
ncbi:MAG: hypothetical protein M3O30_10025 [Planctomycetota bacterium]|nr:hypothetical protein [Planctomycetota bacterium]